MGIRIAQFGCLASCLFLVPSIAVADCQEDRHKVELGQDEIAQLRSYLCQQSGKSGNAQVRIESTAWQIYPAGMVVAKNSSDRLKQILGTYKIADNDVFATYTALMQQFGEDFETRKSMFSIEAAGRGGEVAVADAVSAKVLRVLSNANSSYFYPAVDEAVRANARKIPRGMKYYYDIACKDDDAASGSVCRNPLATTQYFWRSMRADDVTSYSERTRAWNKKFGSIDDQGPFEVPNALKLVNYLAGTSWPEDFVILTGTANQDGCLAGFSYSLPQVMLEIALITN